MTIAPLPEQRKPWERQLGERDRAWHAFQVFRDLGPTRTYAETSRIVGQHRDTISQYSNEFEWKERIALWDREQERVRREAQMAKLQEMGERHARQAEAQTVALTYPAKVFLQRLQDNPEAVEAELRMMPVSELVGLIQRVSGTLPAVFNAERMARGQATERREHIERHEVVLDDSGAGLDFGELLGILAEVRLDPSDFRPEENADGAIEAEAHEVRPALPDPTPIDIPEPPT